MTTSPRSLFNLITASAADRKCQEGQDGLFIVSDGKLEMTGHNTLLLVITGGITRKLKNLGCQVFEDGSQVD